MQQSFMPFGGGTRVCIGIHLARDELRMTAASFFRKFPKMEVISSDKDMEMQAWLLIQPSKKRCIATIS